MDIDSIINEITKTKPKVVSVLGAGVSKASGMPTFRGEDGLWNQYRAEDLATPYAFSKDPKLVWEWYRARMRILLDAEPNITHESLVKLEEEGISIGTITQNVDGLHEIAGLKNFVEIHGRIRYAKCIKCNHSERWDKEELAQKDIELPYCPNCKTNLLRPDVVWFGETLNSVKWEQAIKWTLEANVLLVVGTSGVVHPVASLPYYAKQSGAIIIEFNIEKTPISPISDFSVLGLCEETFPKFTETLIDKIKMAG
ncbi:MAG: NAD-dependent deacylase [Candidatus Thorarchaeota archaeon]